MMAASSDTPIVVQVLHDAQIMLNQAFGRQQEEQKSQPLNAAPEHDMDSAVATITTISIPPLAVVTPTVLLQSEAEEWARLMMRSSRDVYPGGPHQRTADTSTRNNHATVELLYQDFAALCKNAS
jgi:hypothetical protein